MESDVEQDLDWIITENQSETVMDLNVLYKEEF